MLECWNCGKEISGLNDWDPYCSEFCYEDYAGRGLDDDDFDPFDDEDWDDWDDEDWANHEREGAWLI